MVTDYYPGAAKVVDQCGTTFLDIFDEDRFMEIRNSNNIYYPFANRPEWELAEYLLTSGLSMATINHFLSLLLVSRTSLGMLLDLSRSIHSGQVASAFCPIHLAATWTCRDPSQNSSMEVQTYRHLPAQDNNHCQTAL